MYRCPQASKAPQLPQLLFSSFLSIHSFLLVLSVLSIVWLLSTAPSPVDAEPTPEITPIERAYSMAFSGPSSSDLDGPAHRCGTVLMDQLAARWDVLPAEAKALLSSEYRFKREAGNGLLLRGRPDENLFDAREETAHFMVHYATEGENRVAGWPDRQVLDATVEGLEAAYQVFSLDLPEGLGMPVPPGDGETGGGTNLIDVYIFDLGGIWGFAAVDGHTDGGCDHEAGIGFIGIDNRVPETQVQGTPVHEVFHLFQFSLARGAPSWFKESTAVWAMKRTYPDDLAYVWAMSQWCRTPHLSPWHYHPNNPWRVYGLVHFWLFLDQVLSTPENEPSIVPAIWLDLCHEDDLIAILNRLLTDRGHRLIDLYGEFAVWAGISNHRLDDGLHFPDGRHYPSVSAQAWHTSRREYPAVQVSLSPDDLAQELGINYIRFEPTGERSTLEVSLEGSLSLDTDRSVAFIVTRNQRHHTLIAPAVGSDPEQGDLRFEVSNWDRCDQAMLVIANGDGISGEDLPFEYSVSEGGRPVASNIVSLSAYPNPFLSKVTIDYVASGVDGSLRLDIVNASGQRVARLFDGRTGPTNGEITWDGWSDAGFPMPRGIYFLRVERGEERRTLKLVR